MMLVDDKSRHSITIIIVITVIIKTTMRIIAHLDMDAFFAAIEERENPQFRGLGIVVGADPKNGTGRGVVSTANYQARKYGINSAMPISQAWRLAQNAERRGEPKTVFLPVNGHYYSEVSNRIFTIISSFVQTIEPTSIDEAYLDLTFTGDFENAKALILKIKQIIWDQEKLTAKVAIGPNKLVAKISSSLAKPDSLNIIFPQDVSGFLEPLSVRVIPGVGPKTEEFLRRQKIYKIADLKKYSQDELVNWLGKWGEDLYRKARGIDDSPLETDREIKSVSEQETFEVDTLNAEFLIVRLQKISERVIERLRREKISGYKTVAITVRFGDFTTRSRTHTLKQYANDSKTLQNEAMKLFLPFLDSRENANKKLIRLLGVGIENFLNSTAASNEEAANNKAKNYKNKQENLF